MMPLPLPHQYPFCFNPGGVDSIGSGSPRASYIVRQNLRFFASIARALGRG